jgi:hypothetical protein
MRVAIAKPAASSLAELTRVPEDKRCMDVASEFCELFRFRRALTDAALLLMTIAMLENFPSAKMLIGVLHTSREFWVKKSRPRGRLLLHRVCCCLTQQLTQHLTQERHHLLRCLVGLRNHRVACLLQDLRTRQVRRFSREVSIHDATLGRCLVLTCNRQV